uniref:Uncharacterized protein n=1 Tax=viral metagenome TaxID=1070528 RepID=A0A6M3J8G2_9ZZZZ
MADVIQKYVNDLTLSAPLVLRKRVEKARAAAASTKATEQAAAQEAAAREVAAKTAAEQKATAEQAAAKQEAASIGGGINPEQYRDILQRTAAQTRDIGDTTVPAGVEKTLESLTGGYKGIGEMAVSEYGKQAEAQKESAEKAATALKMQGGATIDYLERLENIRKGVTTQATSVRDSFSAAAEKADEYVQAAKGRVGEVMAKLDEINAEIGKDRDFSKAHAMQASVQATLGSMKAEERNILETYGTGSKEYQQFQASKMNALGTVQSNIHAAYQQLQEKQGETYLSTVSDAYTKSNMYLGFQEQQHVDMLKYKADAQNAYDLQVAQFEVGVEQLKSAGMENLANWIIETPTFTMDATPLITMLFDLYSTQVTGQQAARVAKAAEGGGGIDWGQLAGMGVGSLFGGVGAGVGGAIGDLF